MDTMHLFAGWAVEEGLDRKIELCRKWDDGQRLPDGSTALVRTDEVHLGGALVFTGYPYGLHLEAPAERPLALFEDGLLLDAPVGSARLGYWCKQGVPPGRRHDWQLLVLTWGSPLRWRPARPRDGRAPVLPATSLLVLGLAPPTELVVDLDAAATSLEEKGRAPGGDRRVIHAQQRYLVPPSWRTEGEKERHVVAGLIEMVADEAADRSDPTVSPLQAGAAPVAVITDPGILTLLGDIRMVTLWEGLGEDGEPAGIAAVPSAKPRLQNGEAGPWRLGAALGAFPAHRRDRGDPVDELPSVDHVPATWTGQRVVATYELEDADEFGTAVESFALYPLGQVTFPSQRIVLTDPGAAEIGVKEFDLALSHPGPYPVIEVQGSDEGRGLLVLLGSNEPSRWVGGTTSEGEDATPVAEAGAMAVLDRDALPWLRGLRGRPTDDMWRYSASSCLLRSDPSASPDIATLTNFGGDGPTPVSVGLDANGHPVALLVGNDDLTAFDDLGDPAEQ
jgi:hypothetical protein